MTTRATTTGAVADPAAPGSAAAGTAPSDGASTDPSSSGPSSTDPSSTDPTLASLWRAARTPLAVLLLVVLAGCVVAVATAGRGGEPLDPGSAAPAGSLALARLLRGQGVQVVQAGTTAAATSAAGPGTSLLVARPDELSDAQLAQLRDSRSDLVVVAAGPAQLRVLAPDVELGAGGPAQVRDPACDLPAAARAGAADTGGVTYRPPAAAVSCYPGQGGPSLVVLPGAAGTTALLGDGASLTNEHLAHEGDAALALGLLGAHRRLVWYLPTAADLASGQGQGGHGLVSLAPAGVRFGLVQLAVSVVLLALWRARRLGPVVAEPLPVVVRASEAVEGRARLYRRGRARGGSAGQLRAATARRCAARLGLPPSAADLHRPGPLLEALTRATGRPVGELHDLLLGPDPADDTALVRLADTLDTLEREVRQP